MAALGRGLSIAAIMSASPPPTPPSRAPADGETRFKPITLHCEWVERTTAQAATTLSFSATFSTTVSSGSSGSSAKAPTRRFGSPVT